MNGINVEWKSASYKHKFQKETMYTMHNINVWIILFSYTPRKIGGHHCIRRLIMRFFEISKNVRCNKGIESSIYWQVPRQHGCWDYWQISERSDDSQANLGDCRHIINMSYVIEMEPKCSERKHVQQATHNFREKYFSFSVLGVKFFG